MKKNISNLKLKKSKAHGYRFTVGRFLQLAVALVFLVFAARFLYIRLLMARIYLNVLNNYINATKF